MTDADHWREQAAHWREQADHWRKNATRWRKMAESWEAAYDIALALTCEKPEPDPPEERPVTKLREVKDAR